MPPFEAISVDEIIDTTILHCQSLPPHYDPFKTSILECKNRLGRGALLLAVMGMFKRGKSSFINTLLGMDLLPVSVVPVTSIPTTIQYGNRLRCIVTFFNKKPDLVVQESISAIRDCLVLHVAEENNPRNQRCVESVVVECPNPLLANGTTFIDTPGFGSTYMHNTKTTLDMLRKCDAVLFVLSADPPFTQTEVEFLKEVRKAVSRIFFILNKIDLLTTDELKQIDLFIQSVLSKNMGFPPDTRVFHVSAKMGRGIRSAAAETNPLWHSSGMAAITTEIVDFLVREKYFTLSQAVGDKLKKALADIHMQLDADQRELTQPIKQAEKEYERIVQCCNSIRNAMAQEHGTLDAETTALGDFVDKTIDSMKIDLQRRSNEALRAILDNVHLKKPALSQTVCVSLEQQVMTFFDHCFLYVVNALNRPLKKAIMLHVNEYGRLLADLRKSFPSAPLPMREGTTVRDDLEMKPDPGWRLEGVAAAIVQIKLPFCGFFASEKAQRQRYLECYAMAVTEIINRNTLRLTMRIKELLNDLCADFKQDIDAGFEALLGVMSAEMEKTKKILLGLEARARQPIDIIEKQKAAFNDVAKMLV